MKKIFLLLLATVCLLSVFSCEGGVNESEAVSETASEEVSVHPMDRADKIISSLDYKNTGKMGDVDGPAFAVYSNTGYSGATVTMNIEDMEIKTVMPDGKYLNGYAFLGFDVFNESGYWMNCIDVGLCWSGTSGGWHIFYNMYKPVNEDTRTWYESSKKLPKNDTYVMTLKLIGEQKALLTVEAVEGKFKDSVEIEVFGAKADGSNTAALFNVALDYPGDTKVDRNGNPCEDWKEITLANSDKGVCLKSLHAFDLKLFKGEEELSWTNDRNSAVSIWPDKPLEFDYAPTEIGVFDGTEYYINLDMNRK